MAASPHDPIDMTPDDVAAVAAAEVEIDALIKARKCASVRWKPGTVPTYAVLVSLAAKYRAASWTVTTIEGAGASGSPGLLLVHHQG